MFRTQLVKTFQRAQAGVRPKLLSQPSFTVYGIDAKFKSDFVKSDLEDGIRGSQRNNFLQDFPKESDRFGRDSFSNSFGDRDFGGRNERSFGGRDFGRGFGGGRDNGRSFGGGGDRFGGGDRKRWGNKGRGGFLNHRPQELPEDTVDWKDVVKVDPDFQMDIDKIPNLHSKIQGSLERKGFTQLTPVQSESYQIILDGNDVVARSRTGTGKTLAFGIPMVQQIAKQRLDDRKDTSRTPLILVLEPVRELANQVADELRAVCEPFNLSVVELFGQQSMAKQDADLSRGVDMVVATPGRLVDHIQQGNLNLDHITHVVLDEADRMLDMGFSKQVDEILQLVKDAKEERRERESKEGKKAQHQLIVEDSEMPKGGLFSKITRFIDREAMSKKPFQLLLFSATMPKWICTMANSQKQKGFMHRPIFLDCVQEGESRLATTITHFGIPLASGPIRDVINHTSLEVLKNHKTQEGRAIVFANKKSDVDELNDFFLRSGLRSARLHGDVQQATRLNVFKDFKSGRINVLVATDVASRGLDFPNVELIVHSAIPLDVDSYVHRSGRTGRAGKPGKAVALYGRYDRDKINELQRDLQFQFEKMHVDITLPTQSSRSFDFSEDRRGGGDFGRGRGGRQPQARRPNWEEDE